MRKVYKTTLPKPLATFISNTLKNKNQKKIDKKKSYAKLKLAGFC